MAAYTRVAAAAMVAAVVAAAAVGMAAGDFAADRAECADKLMALATCLTYVEAKATARAPTRDCCAGLGTVVVSSKRCMCVLVKDRDEPALGFRINVTRAMDLPSVCSIPATFSDCPQILKMAPDSKEAEIFKQYAREHELKNSTTTPATAAAANAGNRGVASSSTGGADAQCRLFSVLSGLAVTVLASVFVLA